MAVILTPDDIKTLVAELDGWALSQDGLAIEKTFRFNNFNAAFGWMTRAAIKAEQLDHHPEWFNVYNRVEVRLTTHDKNGLTELDASLAKAMDAMASSSGVK